MVGKLNPAGTAFVFLTYLGDGGGGGVNPDYGAAIAVDASGDVYITGQPGATYPTTANAFSPSPGSGGSDNNSFVTELDPSGANLIYSTYVPYTVGYDYGEGIPGGIAVDNAGNIYVTGGAVTGFATTPSAYQSTIAGSEANAFVAEFNPNLSGAASLVYSSFLGVGQGVGDYGMGLALDGSGNVYVTGATTSAGFPTTPGAFQTVYGGGSSDSFVAKFNTSLSGSASLVYSTLLGGSYGDGYYLGGIPGVVEGSYRGPGIAVDSLGQAFVVGETASTNFPTTSGAFQRTYGGPSGTHGGDAYVTKLNAAGSALVYSTYLGGSGNDGAAAVALDSGGNATVVGFAGSTNFPLVNAIQSTNAGDLDMFVTTVNPTGSVLVFSTYLGGTTARQFGSGVALDAAGNVYVSEQARSGINDVYKISAPVGPSFAVSGFPASITAGISGTVTVTALNADGSVNTGYTGTVHFTSSDPQAVLPADTTLTNGTGTFSVTLKTAGTQSITAVDTNNNGMAGSESGITVNAAAATHLVIAGPSSVPSNTSFSVTVTAVDAYGNRATGYRGTVHFSDSVSGANLPGNYTFTSTDAGVHTFTGLKLRTRGLQTITVTDTVNSSIAGTLNITVT
jgi:hypothetical protein